MSTASVTSLAQTKQKRRALRPSPPWWVVGGIGVLVVLAFLPLLAADLSESDASPFLTWGILSSGLILLLLSSFVYYWRARVRRLPWDAWLELLKHAFPAAAGGLGLGMLIVGGMLVLGPIDLADQETYGILIATTTAALAIQGFYTRSAPIIGSDKFVEELDKDLKRIISPKIRERPARVVVVFPALNFGFYGECERSKFSNLTSTRHEYRDHGLGSLLSEAARDATISIIVTHDPALYEHLYKGYTLQAWYTEDDKEALAKIDDFELPDIDYTTKRKTTERQRRNVERECTDVAFEMLDKIIDDRWVGSSVGRAIATHLMKKHKLAGSISSPEGIESIVDGCETIHDPRRWIEGCQPAEMPPYVVVINDTVFLIASYAMPIFVPRTAKQPWFRPIISEHRADLIAHRREDPLLAEQIVRHLTMWLDIRKRFQQ